MRGLGKIGGSDLGALLGLSPWGTPLTLWRRLTGRDQGSPDNPSMREGRAMMFGNRKTQAYQALVAYFAGEASNIECIEGPVRLTVTAVFPRPAYMSRRSKRDPDRLLGGYDGGREPHTAPPDLTNVIKAIEDALTRAGIWVDDRQVFEHSAAKWYAAFGEAPHTDVLIEEVNDETDT